MLGRMKNAPLTITHLLARARTYVVGPGAVSARSLLALTAIAACGRPPPPIVANTAEAATPTLAPAQPLGWLGFGTTAARGDDGPSYAPASAAHALVATATDPALPARVEVVPGRGAVEAFTRGERTKVPYGCDGNQLEVTAFDGPRIAPGVAWILPPGRPASWAPAPLAITSRTATAGRRGYTIGPLAVELERTAPLAGTLTIARDGGVIHRQPFDRVVMDGADDAPIDLTFGGPGVPEPAAAWALAGAGASGEPILLVLLVPGYEGVSLHALVVEASAARGLDAMSQYLYACAF